MATFQFRLATLQKMREAARDERRGQLAEALRAADVLASRRSDLQRELVEVLARLRSAAVGAVDVDRLADAHRYQGILRVDLGAVETQQQALAAEIERRRAALAAADREVRVLENLRERQRERHCLAELRAEIKLLDEAALGGRARREVD